jgi:arylsulfatase A-like enzyme
VFFSSDNGALWPEADIEKYVHRANGPLAGGKARPQEGGHRVPFIARWPGRIAAGTKTGALINHTDFLATFAELLEVDLAKATAGFPSIDSYSFLPVLKNPKTKHERPAMAVTLGSFREGEWKLTITRGRRSYDAESREAAQYDLYHLGNDLGETKDLSESEPERKAQLFAAYQDYFADAPLKPLAIQFLANMNSRKKPARKSPGPAKAKPKPAVPGP